MPARRSAASGKRASRTRSGAARSSTSRSATSPSSSSWCAAAAARSRSWKRNWWRAGAASGRLPGLLLEVLTEHRHLALVIGPEVGAVEALGRRRGPLERQLADRLAVLDHERDVAGAYL